MIRVEGFDKAQQLLARRNFWESFAASPKMAAQIKQVFDEELSPQEVVERIINQVRDKGDKALFDYAKKLDRVELEHLEISRQELISAYDIVDEELISALKLASERIREFHLGCSH
ncbi:unnamed protein product, partial [marine sediment metagenome]